MAKHISWDYKWKINSVTCNSSQKLNNKTCSSVCKSYSTCKKKLTCICENSKYLKSVADTSVITCDKIMSVMGILSTKLTNAIARNVSINSDGKK